MSITSKAPSLDLPAFDLPVDAARSAVLAEVTAGRSETSPLAAALAPIVAGLHRALADPFSNADPPAVRHVYAQLGITPPAADEAGGDRAWTVRVRIQGPLAIGHGTGISVSVDADDGPWQVRSHHVVRVRDEPSPYPGRPWMQRRAGPLDPGHEPVRLAPPSVARVVIDEGAVERYVDATLDGSPVHRGDGLVVPGLLTLARLAHEVPDSRWQTSVFGRFVRPLRPGDPVDVTTEPIGGRNTSLDTWYLDAACEGRALLREARISHVDLR